MIHNLYHFQENLQQQNILWKTRGKAVTISIRRWSPIFPATCKRCISFYLYWLKVYIQSNSSFEKNSIKVYISYRWLPQDMLPFPVKIFAMWQFHHLTEQFDGVVCSSYERHFFNLISTHLILDPQWPSVFLKWIRVTHDPAWTFVYLFIHLATNKVILWYFLTWDICPTWGDLKEEFISVFLFVEIVALEPFILLPALWTS